MNQFFFSFPNLSFHECMFAFACICLCCTCSTFIGCRPRDVHFVLAGYMPLLNSMFKYLLMKLHYFGKAKLTYNTGR